MAAMANIKVRYRYRDKSGSLVIRLSDNVDNMARQIAVLPSLWPCIIRIWLLVYTLQDVWYAGCALC